MSNSTPNRLIIPGFVLNATSTTAPSLTDPSLNTIWKNQVVTVGSDAYFVDANGVARKLGSSAATLTTTSLVPKYHNGSLVDAQANADASLADVLQLSDGSYIHDGKVTWTGHGLTVGSWYYTSQTTAGGYVTPQPTSGWSQQLFFVLDANTILVDIEEGINAATGESVSPYIVTVTASANYARPGGFASDIARYNTISTSECVGGAQAAFNTSTYRFTPQRPGWYDVKAEYDVFSAPTAQGTLFLRKNGSSIGGSSGFGLVYTNVNRSVYMNGSTDYLDAVIQLATGNTRTVFPDTSWFQARWLHA